MAAEGETQVLDSVDENAAPDPSSETPEAPETPETPEEGTTPGEPGGEKEGEEGDGGTPSAPEKEQPPESLLIEIDGKEEEIPVEELVKGYQLARKAHGEIKEARDIKTRADQVLKGLIQDHWNTWHQALTGVIGDSDQALEYIVKEVKSFAEAYGQYEKLPKDRRDLINLQRKLAEREEELERTRREREEETHATTLAQQKQAALVEIATAMKQSGMTVDLKASSTRIFIQEVARKLMDAPEMSTSDAVKEVQKDVLKQLDERLKSVDGFDPELIQGLAPNLVEHFRKKDLNGVKRAQSARVVPKEPAIKRSSAPKPVVLKDGDWEGFLRK